MGQLRPLFAYFRSFQIQFYRKIVYVSGIRTRIIGVECEHADHLTTALTYLLYGSIQISPKRLHFYTNHNSNPNGLYWGSPILMEAQPS